MARKPKPATHQSHLSELLQKHIIFFAGKGGVGKTTAACATAFHLLHRSKGDQRIYLFSTDPAHSLADSIGGRVGRQPRVVARHRRASLYACELDPAPAFEEFKKQYGGILAKVLERGTFLSEPEIDEFLGLSVPGIDEVVALLHLSEIVTGGLYSHILVDTAPSGHTFRFLEMPRVLSTWLDAFDSLEEKHRFMVRQLTRRSEPDRIAEILRGLSRKFEGLESLISDPVRSAFVMVTTPEPMVFEETDRYAAFLERRLIPMTAILINRVQPGVKNCEYCRARAAGQTQMLAELKRRFPRLPLLRVPLFPGEVRGPDLLRSFGAAVWETPGNEAISTKVRNKKRPQPAGRGSTLSDSEFELEPRHILIFGGKGGAGKTTAASAAAIALAERFRQSAVVLLSTDPAHSLSDAFGERVGELKTGLAGIANLNGIEIDSQARFNEFKRRYQSTVDEFFASLTSGSRWTIEFDREATGKLLTMAPPGIDEMLSLTKIAQLLEDQTYDCIIVDTAPSGHLLRLLELPEIALSWIRALLKLMLSYKEVVHWNGIAREIVSLSKSIKRTMSLLNDSSKTEFVAVAIPEEMSFQETGRLYTQLLRLNIPINRLLINNVISLEDGRRCAFCRTRRQEQDRVIGSYLKRFARLRIFVAPQQVRPVQGLRRLRTHFSAWARHDAI